MSEDPIGDRIPLPSLFGIRPPESLPSQPLFNYQGTVELISLSDGSFMSVWVAEFTPATGSTGRFRKVIGGGFTMTAVTAPFLLSDPVDVPYMWYGNGHLVYAQGR